MNSCTVLNSISAIILVVWMIVFSAILYRQYVYPRVKAWRARRRDDVLRLLAEHLTVVHALFGDKVSMYSTTTATGVEVSVACRSCSQKNRLKHGAHGALCGRCKTPILVEKEKVCLV